MTPKELAEKIFLMRGMFFDNKIGQEIHIKRLESLLQTAWSEAMEESYKAGEKSMRGYNDDILVWKKVNEAYTRAAEVARNYPIEVCPDCGYAIAAAIERLKDADTEKLREETK